MERLCCYVIDVRVEVVPLITIIISLQMPVFKHYLNLMSESIVSQKSLYMEMWVHLQIEG
jgi:hypothetical protein